MALLGTFIDKTSLSLVGNAAGCVLHGLPDAPDYALYMGATSTGMLVSVLSMGTGITYVWNTGGSTGPGVLISVYAHSIVR